MYEIGTLLDSSVLAEKLSCDTQLFVAYMYIKYTLHVW